jgi:hypothetical protein
VFNLGVYIGVVALDKLTDLVKSGLVIWGCSYNHASSMLCA